MVNNYKKFLLEGKKEQDKINELLDKGKLSDEEKSLLQRLIKGGKLDDEPKPKPKPPEPFVVKKVKPGYPIPPEGNDWYNPQTFQVGNFDNMLNVIRGGGGGGRIPPENPPPPPREPENVPFKKGDRVIYENENSANNGRTGIVVEIREDGRVIISFDGDGKKLAANPKNIKLQPKKGNIKKVKKGPPPEDYNRGEREDWYENEENPMDRLNQFHQRYGFPPPYPEYPQDGPLDDENYENDLDNPAAIYFCIMPAFAGAGHDNPDDGLNVILTPINYWNENHVCLDDAYGIEVNEMLRQLGIYELAESLFEYHGRKTLQRLRADLEKLGFVWNDELLEFMQDFLF
jgi:hypothetical protein